MNAILPGLPPAEEVPEFFRGYVSKATPFPDPAGKLAAQKHELLGLLQSLPAAKRAYRYAEGKWTIAEVLGHLIDAERIFAYRALRIGRGDQTPLSPFEENSYVAAADSSSVPWESLLDEFAAVRDSTVVLFRNLPPAAWANMGISSGKPVSVRALAFVMVGHVEHHASILRERYL